MTASNDLPPLNSGISSPPNDPAANVALLPPPSKPPSRHANTDNSSTIRLLEGLLLMGVLALAFLLASLPARNSDVWLHLASGRLLAQGQYHFGVDPFVFTTSGVRWVNPSWLYDLLSFCLFQLGGGAALVIAKAVGMALLAWFLIDASRAGKHSKGWAVAGFAALALIVVGSSMPLRPICVSYLFLALTLWLLERRCVRDPRLSLASRWPMLLLFALWANLDAWFLLGPLTVGLYLLGALLSGREQPAQTRSLGFAFVAGLAACLLNPHGFHIFALPPLLPFSPETALLSDDPIFSRLVQTPFQMRSFRFQDIPHLGLLLYFLLIFLGPISFLLNGVAARSGDYGARSACLRRLPAWLAFFALSALDVSTIPFMAIVAAPLTALNFQEYLRRRQAADPVRHPRSPGWSIGGRILALLGILGLVFAAWPGWLQGRLREPRGWMVEVDSSLVDAVRQVEQWRREGRIRAGETVFNFSPTAAHYFAWFAPQEKSFCDSRWRLCASAARDYVTVRRALLGDASTGKAFADIFRQHRVAYLLLHDSDVQRTAEVFQRLVSVSEEWPILFLQGDSIVFGWRDALRGGEADRFADWRVDFHQRAFQPPESERAPEQGTHAGPHTSDWRSFWTTASSAPSHAREEAALYLLYFDVLRPSFLFRHRAAWENSLATGIMAGPPALSNLPRQFLAFTALQVSRDGARPRADGAVWPLDDLALRLAANYDSQQDEGPPGLALLALRAARRAIHDNPNDARAYQLLGEAYLHLLHNTRERLWKRDLPSLTHIRQIQAAVALHRALLLQPDLIQAHTDLYFLYQDMGLLDLALRHLREMVRLTPTQGAVLGQGRDSRSEQLRQMKQAVEKLDTLVRKNESKLETEMARHSVVERAAAAFELGLAHRALSILLASDVAVFGKRGTEMELDLLLLAGRIQDARDWMSPSQEAELGSESYHRLRVLLYAANGDYQACEEELARMTAAFDRPMKMVFRAAQFRHTATKQPTPPAQQPATIYQLEASPRQIACLKIGQLLLNAARQQQTISHLLEYRLPMAEILEHLKAFSSEVRQLADVEVVRGALALERGDVEQAQSFLRRALSVWGNETEANLGGGLDFGGRRAAQGFLDWLSRPQARISGPASGVRQESPAP